MSIGRLESEFDPNFNKELEVLDKEVLPDTTIINSPQLETVATIKNVNAIDGGKIKPKLNPQVQKELRVLVVNEKLDYIKRFNESITNILNKLASIPAQGKEDFTPEEVSNWKAVYTEATSSIPSLSIKKPESEADYILLSEELKEFDSYAFRKHFHKLLCKLFPGEYEHYIIDDDPKVEALRAQWTKLNVLNKQNL